MAMIKVSAKFLIIEKAPPFDTDGVFHTYPAILATLELMLSNKPVKLSIMPSTRRFLIHSLIASRIKFIRDYLVNNPERSGTRIMLISATPPPVMRCFMPWDFAPELSLPDPSRILIIPKIPSPAPSPITSVCNTVTA